jgi:signal transduction histidine kinase/ligand-binding sensor domain-containing protein
VGAPAHAVTYSGTVANWEMRDGLPSNKVFAALQTRDGYIWLGTPDGFARFDGASFTRFDAGRTPGLVESSVSALFESPDRALWIGHSSGAVTRMLDGKFRYYPASAQREGSRIQNLACDEAGDVWAFNTTGQLFRVRDDFTLTPENGPTGPVYFMAGSPDGKLAVVSRGKLSILEQSRLRTVEVPADLEPFVRGVCSSSDGGWWVVVEGRLWKWKSGEWTEVSCPLPTGSTLVFAMTELRDGRLAGATYDAGAWIIQPTAPGSEQRFTLKNGFASDWITSVFEDREAGVWLATGTTGLCRVAEKKVTMLAPAEGLEGRPVLSVTEGPDGTLWIGTEGRGVFRYQDGTWTQFRSNIGLANHFVWSVATTPDGTLWAGTWGNGIFRLGEGKFHGPDDVKGLHIWQVAAMVPSVQGGLLVGTSKGIYRWDGRVAQWLEPGATRVAANVRALLEEEGGSVVWGGCWERGLVRIAAAGVRQYTRADGLTSNDVNCLYSDRRGALWIGTNGGGLNRLKDGRIDVVSTVHGLSDNFIGHIVEDATGNHWVSSRGGLMRISAAQLHACADGAIAHVDVETFGYSDGLATLNFSTSTQPTGCVLRTGQLAFATDRGVAVIDPANLPRNRVPPPVYIESIEISGRRIAIGEGAALRHEIPAGFERLKIKYTALSFAGPEKVMFRRQLQPLEQRPTVVRNERSVLYNYLPPGTYTFSVSAANNDGVWNPDARRLTLVVLPFFWQTTWFRALGAGLLIAASGTIAWYVSRRRLQRRLELLEREHAIERERTRIANDMHDELGSQLTRISMLSESARRQSSDPARVGERLGQIYDTARDVTKAMDEIVWTVNPRHDTLESLVTYLEKYTVDFVGTAGVGCRIEAPFETIAWSPNAEVRHNLFLCLKEALTNIVRHSGATMVVLTIRTDGGEFFMQIADNGKGLALDARGRDASSRAGGGNGLINLRARMARLGGSFEITSSPEKGCSVTLRLPLSAVAHSSGHSNV